LRREKQLDRIEEAGGAMVRNEVENAANEVQTFVILHQMMR
jgi:hypothetical protein